MRICKTIGSLVLVLALAVSLALSLVPLEAQAAYESSGDGDVRLTIRYNPGVETVDTTEDGVERQGYRLYQIATVDPDGQGFVLNEAYKDLVGTHIPTTMTPYNAFKSIDWDLVERTGEYINANAPEPTFAAPIVNGEAVFTNLPQGLYLGTGPACIVNGKTATPVPFVVSLPYMVEEGQAAPDGVEPGVFYTDVTVSLKFSTPTGGHTPGTPDTPDEPDNPPDEPPIDIPDEPVPLVDIPDEPVPLVDIPDEPTPLIEIPDQPVPTKPAQPENPKTPEKPETPTTDIPDEPVPLAMLPQTGLLWWPVPVMAVAGAALTSVGMLGRRRAE